MKAKLSSEVQNLLLLPPVSRRVIDKLNQIISENQGKSILIVTHTVVVKLIMAYFEDRPIKDLWNPPYIHQAFIKISGEGFMNVNQRSQ